MRRIHLIVVSGLFSLPVLGQDLLQCLDPDVLTGLVRNGSTGVGDAVVTREIPDVMAGINPPESFELIASAVNESGATVAFRAEPPNDEAHELALTALEDDGWTVRGRERVNIYYPGSATSPVPSLTSLACLDTRSVQLGSRLIEGTSYVNYHISTNPPTGLCSADSSSPLVFAASANAIEQFMPRLRFPSDPVTGQAIVVRPLGSGSNSSSRYSSTQVTIAMPMTQLATALGTQLGDTGWTADTSWAGALTAGSTWTRQPDSDNDLMATLEVLALSPETFEVSLRIAKLN